MEIYIASDHGGFELKTKLKNSFLDRNIIDLGANSFEPEDDYPDYAEKLCERVLASKDSVGILICKTGIGMSIAANKFKGIFAALCFTANHAEKAKAHNNANVLCLDALILEEEVHLEIVKRFLETKFDPLVSRHKRRVDKIKKFEEIM